MFIDCNMFILISTHFVLKSSNIVPLESEPQYGKEPALQNFLKGKLKQTLQISLTCDYLPWKYPSYTVVVNKWCVYYVLWMSITLLFQLSKLDILNSIAILWYDKFYHFVSFCNFLTLIYWKEFLECCNTCNRISIALVIKGSQKEKKPKSECHNIPECSSVL